MHKSEFWQAKADIASCFESCKENQLLMKTFEGSVNGIVKKYESLLKPKEVADLEKLKVRHVQRAKNLNKLT